MKKIALLLACLPLFLQAQDSIQKPACLKPWSVEILTGMSIYTDIPFSLDDMQKVAPSSQFLQRDFSGYANNYGSSYNGFTLNSIPYFSALVNFVPYAKKKKDYKWYSTIRAGFSFSQVYVQGPSYWKLEKNHIDTLYPGNGTTIYDDSIFNKNYSFDWQGQSFGLDVSQLFHTDEKRNFSIGMGYGIHLGMVMNTYFRASYSEFNYIETTTVTPPSSTNTVESNFKFNSETENIRTKNVFAARIYFPLTMQIRLSKKKNFLNKIALTSESRGSIDIQPVPGFGTLTRFYFNQNFGVKYYFEYNAVK